VKDTAEVTCIKKAAFLAANAFTKFTVPQIESTPALVVMLVILTCAFLTLRVTCASWRCLCSVC